MGEAYDHIQRAYGEYYASAQTVPAATTVAGDEGAQENSGTMGGLEIILQAATAVTFSVLTALLSVWILHATVDLAAYYATYGRAMSVRGNPTGPYTAGTVLGRFIMPADTYRFTKAVISTDDTGATGTIDIFPALLPR